MLNLGEIIDMLKLIDKQAKHRGKEDVRVYFTFCRAFPVLRAGSSRCFYERLAIDWTVRRRNEDAPAGQAPTVGVLAEFLEKMVGQTVQGYKGGEYTISKDSILHVDEWGECTSTVVVGVRDKDYEVLLETEVQV